MTFFSPSSTQPRGAIARLFEVRKARRLVETERQRSTGQRDSGDHTEQRDAVPPQQAVQIERHGRHDRADHRGPPRPPRCDRVNGNQGRRREHGRARNGDRDDQDHDQHCDRPSPPNHQRKRREDGGAHHLGRVCIGPSSADSVAVDRHGWREHQEREHRVKHPGCDCIDPSQELRTLALPIHVHSVRSVLRLPRVAPTSHRRRARRPPSRR